MSTDVTYIHRTQLVQELSRDGDEPEAKVWVIHSRNLGTIRTANLLKQTCVMGCLDSTASNL